MTNSNQKLKHCTITKTKTNKKLLKKRLKINEIKYIIIINNQNNIEDYNN